MTLAMKRRKSRTLAGASHGRYEPARRGLKARATVLGTDFSTLIVERAGGARDGDA